jgi:putative holliday junction resolvase
MKYIGIDYGEKRVGVAISDEGGILAFPKEVLPGGPGLIEKVLKIVKENNVDQIVVGESKNYNQEPNKIMKEIEKFVADLKGESLNVVLHPEFLSSVEASKIQTDQNLVDAQAAAIILQSYLDTINLSQKNNA